jgi:hypothetical protein
MACQAGSPAPAAASSSACVPCAPWTVPAIPLYSTVKPPVCPSRRPASRPAPLHRRRPVRRRRRFASVKPDRRKSLPSAALRCPVEHLPPLPVASRAPERRRAWRLPPAANTTAVPLRNPAPPVDLHWRWAHLQRPLDLLFQFHASAEP